MLCSDKNDHRVTPIKKTVQDSSWPREELHNPRVTVPGAGCDAALCSGTRQQGGCVPTWGLNHKHDALLPTNHWATFMCHPNKMSPTFCLSCLLSSFSWGRFYKTFSPGGVCKCGCEFVVEFWHQLFLHRFSWTCTSWVVWCFSSGRVCVWYIATQTDVKVCCTWNSEWPHVSLCEISLFIHDLIDLFDTLWTTAWKYEILGWFYAPNSA